MNTYSYVSNNPISFVDPMGLAECDVDDMTALAQQENPDMEIDRPGWMIPFLHNTEPDKYNGSVTVGYTPLMPWASPLLNKNTYGGILTPNQRVDLYNTIVHENWHANKQGFGARFKEGLGFTSSLEAAATAQGNARAKKAKQKIIDSGEGSCKCKK